MMFLVVLMVFFILMVFKFYFDVGEKIGFVFIVLLVYVVYLIMILDSILSIFFILCYLCKYF